MGQQFQELNYQINIRRRPWIAVGISVVIALSVLAPDAVSYGQEKQIN